MSPLWRAIGAHWTISYYFFYFILSLFLLFLENILNNDFNERKIFYFIWIFLSWRKLLAFMNMNGGLISKRSVTKMSCNIKLIFHFLQFANIFIHIVVFFFVNWNQSQSNIILSRKGSMLLSCDQHLWRKMITSCSF